MQHVYLKSGRILDLMVYPSWQGPLGPLEPNYIMNDVFAVRTPEGLVLVHRGDSSFWGDYQYFSGSAGSPPWIKTVKNKFSRIDLLFAKEVMKEQYMTELNPTFFIPAHLYEVGHPFSSWSNAYSKSYTTYNPWLSKMVILTWGESIHYSR